MLFDVVVYQQLGTRIGETIVDAEEEVYDLLLLDDLEPVEESLDLAKDRVQ